ncbi:matrixin family metalloprotease [Microvirga aerophila]|uniref:Peptidase metallopeptidase domain-containing protein n=1 Tax=Microvirga aerophila TaxID=670291 RepID=A0A512BP14_9HYPH|nr:matrixin family metalloprotease [Microvirga aerophila]GEO13627.1 hypothetical protein MAE02_13230 [Microvirga aerophila]
MPNYKALLSGQSWNALSSLKISKQPVFLTYTFGGPQRGSTEFGNADKAMARKALKMWGDACGIRFIEVKGADAELKFQWKWLSRNSSGRAEFPELYKNSLEEDVVRDDVGGNIYLNDRYHKELSTYKSFKFYILLHEIGHALGLKHPFHKMAHNKQLLKSDLDHVKHTVMSYTGGDINMMSPSLGRLDIQAIRALYGNPSQDGKQVAKWSWSSTDQTLTQIGKGVADIIYGVAVKDILNGDHGDDKIYGFGGNDVLYGDVGNDDLRGGYGDDTLQGGTGSDTLRGGYGDDMLYGDIDNDVLKGEIGDDILHGGAGNDDLDGGHGQDMLHGDIGDDALHGGNGWDVLQGGLGNDALNGGESNDTLQGGEGSDTLTGGEGGDRFVFDTWFNGVDDIDQITDFSDLWDLDVIVLSSAIFALEKGPLGWDAFVEGSVARDTSDRIIFNAGERSLSYDPDGSGPSAAVRFAKLTGAARIDSYDFFVV